LDLITWNKQRQGNTFFLWFVSFFRDWLYGSEYELKMLSVEGRKRVNGGKGSEGKKFCGNF